MSYAISQSLVDQLFEIFKGEPWYGDSLMKKLMKIRQEAEIPQALNLTASYIQHLINWRQFVIKKLKGEAEFDIQLNSVSDWTDISIQQFSDWDRLINQLTLSQNELIDLIKRQSNDTLKAQVPGKGYSIEYMVHGLIQHEVYHTGQIAVYWKNRE